MEYGDRLEIDGRRYYWTPEGALASVTTINAATPVFRKLLGYPAKEKRKSISKTDKEKLILGTSENASFRGSLVHSLAENYLKGVDLEGHLSKDSEILRYWEPLKTVLGEFTPKLLEEFVYSGLYRYAGTLDFYGEYKGLPTLVDFKTSYTLDYESSLEKWFLQTVAYSAALKQNKGLRTSQNVILVALPEETRIEVIGLEEMRFLWEGWKAKCNCFWEKYPNNNPDSDLDELDLILSS